MKTMTNISYAALALFALACLVFSPQLRAVCRDDCNLNKGNTFQGDDALGNNTTGVSNTAIGSFALNRNTAGYYNTAIGKGALQFNTTGNFNTASGLLALYSNTTGSYNTATGEGALLGNTIGNYNTANGYGALYSPSTMTGNENTASGLFALFSNTTGSYNNANGSNALGNNTDGNYNTANGSYSLLFNTTGSSNTALGYSALLKNTGSNNIAIGASAGLNLTTGSNNIHIGALGAAAEANTIRIGNLNTQKAAYFQGIRGVTVASGIGVIVGTDGQLGTTTSSARYKDNIKPMADASATILSLKPVTFIYKKDLDPAAIPQFGLVAEEVAKVDPDLVARDDQGKPYTVRYEAVNAMLLNEFLKEHKKVETLEAKVAKLEATLEKVSARLETEQPAPRFVESR
jgi:hypothetical protein